MSPLSTRFAANITLHKTATASINFVVIGIHDTSRTDLDPGPAFRSVLIMPRLTFMRFGDVVV